MSNFITEILRGRVGVSRLGQLLVNQADGDQGAVSLVKTVTISSAQVLALNATPQTVIAAPGAGIAIVPRMWAVHKIAAAAYAGIAAGEDLILRHGTSSVQVLSAIETTGFLDQSTAQTRVAGMLGSTSTTPADYSTAANLPAVVQLLVGEITTGTAPLRIRIWYDLLPIPF